MNLSPDALNNIKKGIDVLGYLNKANVYVMNLLDFQQKNIFEIALYPASFNFKSATSYGTAALDTVMTRLYLQGIDIDFNSLEYESADLVKYVKSIVRPESVTLHFIETELALVRNYIQYWKNEVYIADPLKIFQYVFRDDQNACKKNALVMPFMGIGIPSPGMIKLEGLKPKSQEAITLGHGEADPMVIDLTCSVDKVDWVTAVDFFI